MPLIDPPTLIVCVALAGLCVGSFLNVVIYRLPRMLAWEWLHGEHPHEQTQPHERPLSLAFPASHCPSCQRPVRALENIPVFSYVWLRGRCAGCRQKISPRYPLVELASAVLAALAAWHFGAGLALLGALLLLWSLMVLIFIDIDQQILPDCLTLPLLWLGLLFNVFDTFVPLRDAVLGAAAGYVTLWCIFWIFKILTGKEGMGYGDFKLLAALGAWLGWTALLPIIVQASIAASLVGLLLMRRRGASGEVPLAFGPYLAAGGAVVLFVGPGSWF